MTEPNATSDALPASGPGMLLIISGPSGVGKTTIAHFIERRLGGVFSVSMTTRPRAANDREGIDYYFVDRATFEAARDEGGLLEWAQIYENYYGTPRKPVEQALREGKLIILEIDVQGARQIKQALPEAFSIFILPPSEDVLLKRLEARKRDDEATIRKRYAEAKREIADARSDSVYDRFIINEHLEEAMGEAIDTVRAELNRRRGLPPGSTPESAS